jgi:peptide/nickel transport system permease protein
LFRYIIRRFIQTIPVLIGVSFLVFSFVHLIPGDPATVMLGERASAENIAKIREQLGLNRPLLLNFPYDYTYNCPDNYDGLVLDFALFTIPGSCQRQVTYKEGWALLRMNEKSELKSFRVTNAGKPDEKTEELDIAKTLRLVGVRKIEDLNLVPGEPKTFDVRTGKVTVTLDSSRTLVSDLLDSQYFTFIGRILRGDLGNSIQGNIPIAPEFFRRFPATIELALASLCIAVAVGIPIGILSALKRNSWLDTLSMFGALLGVSLPIFVLGLLSIYIFSVQLGWLPTGQRLDPNMRIEPITGIMTLDALLRLNFAVFFNAIKHLIMPALVLSTIPLAIIARITRSAMLEVLHQDYVRTARAKGLMESMIIIRHALRNALLPIVTIIGLQLGALLSGAVLTETIFSWQGIGGWLYESISGRDYPIVQSISLMVTLIYVGINLLVDLAYAWFNPRVRYD